MGHKQAIRISADGNTLDQAWLDQKIALIVKRCAWQVTQMNNESLSALYRLQIATEYRKSQEELDQLITVWEDRYLSN